jgi:hypothetical protein
LSFPNCFIDSFSHYSTNDLYGLGNGQKWTGIGNNSATTNTFISLGTGLFGNSLRVLTQGNAYLCVFKTLGNLATWVIGFRWRTSGTGISTNIFALSDGAFSTVQNCILLNTDNTLSLVRSTTTAVTGGKSTNTIVANTWYYIEMKCTIASSIGANTWQLNVNGTNWVNVTTGQNSQQTGNATANLVVLGEVGFSNTSVPFFDYCDFYCDGGGAVNGGAFWGDTKIECHWPIATGTYTAWTPVNGLGVGCINDETPSGDINYLSDNTTNDKSTFLFQPLGSTPASIMCVQTVYDIRKNDSGTRQVADYCRSNGTDAVGTTVNPGNSYVMYTNVLNQDPHTSAAWTASNLNAAEFGVEEIS